MIIDAGPHPAPLITPSPSTFSPPHPISLCALDETLTEDQEVVYTASRGEESETFRQN